VRRQAGGVEHLTREGCLTGLAGTGQDLDEPSGTERARQYRVEHGSPETPVGHGTIVLKSLSKFTQCYEQSLRALIQAPKRLAKEFIAANG
jgi:hypothetical protein